MRIISKSRLKQFWELPENKEAEGPLKAWHTHVQCRSTAWQAWGHLKGEFNSASIVGNCVVFNIGGNKFRLITRPIYASQKIFILKVMTHAEYDRNLWPKECGCFAPPPPKKRSPKPKRGAKDAR